MGQRLAISRRRITETTARLERARDVFAQSIHPAALASLSHLGRIGLIKRMKPRLPPAPNTTIQAPRKIARTNTAYSPLMARSLARAPPSEILGLAWQRCSWCRTTALFLARNELSRNAATLFIALRPFLNTPRRGMPGVPLLPAAATRTFPATSHLTRVRLCAAMSTVVPGRGAMTRARAPGVETHPPHHLGGSVPPSAGRVLPPRFRIPLTRP